MDTKNLLKLDNKKKGEIVMVLEIGNASVGGVVVKCCAKDDDLPEIITSARMPVNFLMDVNFEAFWRCTKNKLEKVIKKLYNDFPNRPDRIACIFSSPWFLSQTRTITVKRREEFEITEDFIEKLIDNEINIFKDKWHTRMPFLKDNPQFIEKDIMKVKLNGYVVDNIFDKKAKSLEAQIYLSLNNKEIKEDIDKIISDVFSGVVCCFHTMPFVVFNILRSVINANKGFLFVDVGGEITDVSVARDNILEETISFPIGKNNMIRKIASEQKTFIKDAESALERFNSGHLNASERDKIESTVKKITTDWCNSFHKSLRGAPGNSLFSRDIFLIGGENMGEELIDCMQGDSFSKFSIWGKPFKVNRVSPDSLKHYFKFRKSFKESKDVFLLIDALFANGIINKTIEH